MKKIIILLLTLFVGNHIINASFPVEQSKKSEKQTIVVKKEKTTENNSKVIVKEQSQNAEVSEASVPAAPAAGGGKSQLVALLLCAFLGGLGIHRFYLGYTWQGIVQLLTGGACGVWTLIDFIRIITGSLVPKNGSYAKTL